MRRPYRSIVFWIVCVLAPLAARAEDYQCLALQELKIPGVVIGEVSAIPAGPFAIAAGGPGPMPASLDLAAFCRVKVRVAPAINIEIWLPRAEDWNRRLQAVGGFGLAGAINHRSMVPVLQKGYATVSTDTGHTADDKTWLMDPVRMRDYGYRAIHEMTLLAKVFIKAYYNRQQDYAYFNGCSTGGREALMEAQRFPTDYDGIIGGAPVNWFVADHIAQLWVTLVAKPVAETLLGPEALALVTKSVLAQCDALDGVSDGVLEDPRRCDFKPASLACKNTSGPQCLSPEQVTALEKIYAGPVHPRTGQRLSFSPVPGGESPSGGTGGWSLVTSKGDFVKPYDVPVEFFGRTVLSDPDWNWRTFDFDRDVDLAMRRTGALLEATDPNLDAFRANGGRLILYHGWNDPFLPPEGTVAYYQSVIDHLPMTPPEQAAVETAGFARLFMVPGMAHCRGGPGTDTFDMMAAIEEWVERGNAPERIIASHRTDGQVTRTRPLCPYPQLARYSGNGSTDEAANFVCAD